MKGQEVALIDEPSAVLGMTIVPAGYSPDWFCDFPFFHVYADTLAAELSSVSR